VFNRKERKWRQWTLTILVHMRRKLPLSSCPTADERDIISGDRDNNINLVSTSCCCDAQITDMGYMCAICVCSASVGRHPGATEASHGLRGNYQSQSQYGLSALNPRITKHMILKVLYKNEVLMSLGQQVYSSEI